jgi:hypothetical protein
VHENPAASDLANERRILQTALAAPERAAAIQPPLGYRSPAWDFSKNTVQLLLEHHFLYDSSCMGHDFYPYYLRRDDAWTADDQYRFGPLTRLVELPVTWGLDDFPPFETTRAATLASPCLRPSRRSGAAILNTRCPTVLAAFIRLPCIPNSSDGVIGC